MSAGRDGGVPFGSQARFRAVAHAVEQAVEQAVEEARDGGSGARSG